MEIHELNTFSGTPGSGDYLATDNGNDTSKISVENLLAPLNARIDNIIASPAPSEQEIIDARLGASVLGGVQYASLGDAVRKQVEALYNIDTDIKYSIEAANIPIEYITSGTSGSYNGITYYWDGNRCFLSGTASADFQSNLYVDTSNFPGNIAAGDIVTLNIDSTDNNIYIRTFPYVNGSWGAASQFNETGQFLINPESTGMIIRLYVPAGNTVNGSILAYITGMPTNKETGEVIPVVLPDTAYNTKTVVEAVLAKYGQAIFGGGTYLTSGYRMPDNTKIIGAGDSTIISTYSGTNGIVVGSNCTIENVKIVSPDGHTAAKGARAGIWVEGNKDSAPFVFNTKIANVSIEGFSLAGIYGAYTGYYVANSISAVNCKITNCYAGVLLENFCEFNRFTNILCYFCYVGLMNLSGNNVFVNCSFSNNTVGVYLIGDDENLSGNNGHGTLVGCTINHSNNNSGFAVICRGISANGFVFDTCQIWYGKIQVENSSGIMFSNCMFGAYNTNTEIINYSSNALFILNCLFKVGATFSGSGGITKVANSFKFDGTEITI